MSDNIPFEIQVEIIQRLPVKSLLQFRSVSKQWKSLIDSSEFNADYIFRQTQPERLFVRYKECRFNKEYRETGVHSLLDGETFAQQEFAPTDHVLDEQFYLTQPIGSSHGLLCFYGNYHQTRSCDPQSMMSVIWNPSIRKLIGVEVYHVGDAWAQVVLGFGVCPNTLDPTIVKITKTIPWVVEIFTLSTGCWRISSSNLQDRPIYPSWSQVAIGKLIYWVAFEMIVTTNGESSKSSLIVSFDMTTEEFGVINLPDSLARKCRTTLSVFNLWESLTVIEYSHIPNNQVCVVWNMMDDHLPNSFTRLFIIDTSFAVMKILDFTDRGELIMETRNNCNESAVELVVYEPMSEHFNHIGKFGKNGSLFVGSYIETLLLLGEWNCDVYSDAWLNWLDVNDGSDC